MEWCVTMLIGLVYISLGINERDSTLNVSPDRRPPKSGVSPLIDGIDINSFRKQTFHRR
jgi:hypothetical protein